MVSMGTQPMIPAAIKSEPTDQASNFMSAGFNSLDARPALTGGAMMQHGLPHGLADQVDLGWRHDAELWSQQQGELSRYNWSDILSRYSSQSTSIFVCPVRIWRGYESGQAGTHKQYLVVRRS